MSAALKSLNFTTLQKPSTNPTLDRRATVIARLEEQKLLLGDPSYKRTVRSWSKNQAGEKSLVEKKQRVLPWWTAQPNGSYAFLSWSVPTEPVQTLYVYFAPSISQQDHPKTSPIEDKTTWEVLALALLIHRHHLSPKTEKDDGKDTERGSGPINSFCTPVAMSCRFGK